MNSGYYSPWTGHVHTHTHTRTDTHTCMHMHTHTPVHHTHVRTHTALHAHAPIPMSLTKNFNKSGVCQPKASTWLVYKLRYRIQSKSVGK